MCNFFSCIATKDGRILFTEQDSHSEIIKRAKLQDTELFSRKFVRLECLPPFNCVTVDEQGTLPSWFEDIRLEVESRVIDLSLRVEKYNTKYKAVQGPAEAEYEAAEDAAWAEYEAAEDAAWAEYKAVQGPARAECEAVTDAAWAEYEAVEGPAWAEYTNSISKLEGFVKDNE